ncbi:MAG: UbiA prenyltransferase family protein [Candidatus Heimdallarchaeota archaeon]|nr:MAG: UbiA prenyltransferase family protein [Candidatus Heimdallarchaeota archaeon]
MRNLDSVRIFLQSGIQYFSYIKTQLFLTVMLFYLSQIESLESLYAFEFPKIELGDYIYLIRPYGWISNFVSIGFGLLLTNVWVLQGPSILLKYMMVGIAVGPLLWGGLYTFNSVFDADFDRIHPTKMHRPVASERVSKNLGLFIATIHVLLGLVMLSLVSMIGLFLGLIMVGLQILYCFPPFRLKETVVNLFFSGPLNHFIRILIGWSLVLPILNAPYFFLIGITCILAIGYLSYKIQDKEISEQLGYRGLENFLHKRGIITFDCFLALSASLLIALAFLTNQITWHLLIFIPLSFLIFIYIWVSSSSLWQVAKPGIYIGKLHNLLIIFFLIEWLIIIIRLFPFLNLF